MSSKAHIAWPQALARLNCLTTWTENTQAQKQLNAAGEKLASLMWFDGSELDSISYAIGAGTNCTTMNLSIQLPDATHDTINVTGYPDGTAIANSSVDVASVGGTAAWITHTFGATGPSPYGAHWVVLAPSGGAFNILPRYVTDWGFSSFERMYDAADWGQVVTVGPTPFRVKRKDGTYIEQILASYPPFSTVAETANSRSTVTTGTVVSGVKFTAPYDMVMVGITLPLLASFYSSHELVLINSSNTVLSRGTGVSYYWPQTSDSFVGLQEPVQLTAGDTYRFYFKNPAEDANTCGMYQTITITSGDYVLLNLSSGDWCYTTANDPASEGGAGSWTDTATELPIAAIVGHQDLDALSAGGGETDPDKVLANSSLISGNVDLANVLNTETHGTYVPVATGDVQDGVTYGAASALTGTFVAPATGDVQSGVTYGNAGEYTGTFAAPATGDVQSGVTYGDAGEFTGTFAAPATGDVQSGVTYGNAGEFTGTFAAPAAGDVQSGVTYGNAGEFTGTFAAPAAGDVRSGTTYGNAGEFTGTCAVPVAGDVQSGVAVDATTGTFVSPAVGDVQSGVTYGNAGEFTGVFAVPAVGDVEAGVTFGNAGEFTGTFVVPAVGDVEDGVFYGAGGTEFEGTLVVSGGSGETVNVF